MDDTTGVEYTERLQTKAGARWKQWVDVQAPYRWNLRRHQLGRTLDVGCGLGRNLLALPAGSLGVDHNATSVAVAKSNGLPALTVPEWEATGLATSESFDSILLAHVVEHMPYEDAVALLHSYLGALRRGGKVLFICPQERGYASDPTHVAWTTGDDLARLSRDVGLVPGAWTSFPGPRSLGTVFLYNEFNLVARKL